ncbi:hypothetical protein HZS_1319 [Henneguya salminicola]|nr:hypothetical protein HZS_1319 [Henneguya salminicola]
MAILLPKADKPKSKKKIECIAKVKTLSDDYQSMIVFNCNNVGSNQLKKIRTIAREHGNLFMGKNTLFKKGLLSRLDKSKYDRLIPQLFGNVGLFFTNKNLKDMRDMLESITEMAPVKANMIAQCDVVIPKGVTGLAPDKTSFFQALSIATMINKANIQILSDVHLLKKGQKVGASEAALMQMLDIRPFSYKLHTKFIYENGLSYPPDVLDITKADILVSFQSAISDVACLSLSISYPTSVSVPYLVQNSLTELVALCMEAEISNSFVEEVFFTFFANVEEEEDEDEVGLAGLFD